MTSINTFLDFVEEDTGKRPATKWAICGNCRGSGGTSAYLGSFSQEDMAEQDDEWIADYMAGRFDQVCDECDGSGKVRQVIDEKIAEDWAEWCAEEAADRHTRWMESGCPR